jgi:hypothetical protein
MGSSILGIAVSQAKPHIEASPSRNLKVRYTRAMRLRSLGQLLLLFLHVLDLLRCT